MVKAPARAAVWPIVVSLVLIGCSGAEPDEAEERSLDEQPAPEAAPEADTADPEPLASCQSPSGTPANEEGETVADVEGSDLRQVTVAELDEATWQVTFELHDQPLDDAGDYPSGVFWSVHLADDDHRVQVGAALDGTELTGELSELTGDFETRPLPDPTVDGSTITLELPTDELDFEPTRFYALTEYLDETTDPPLFVHDTCPQMDDWMPAQPHELPAFELDTEPVASRPEPPADPEPEPEPVPTPDAAEDGGSETLLELEAGWATLSPADQEGACAAAEEIGMPAFHRSFVDNWGGPGAPAPPSLQELTAFMSERC